MLRPARAWLLLCSAALLLGDVAATPGETSSSPTSPRKKVRMPRVRNYNTTSKWQAGRVNVHFVPHTHADTGWLKTVDQYYYGAQNSIQRATVQNVLNSVVKELAWNPDRRYIVVEQAFFQRWWAEASDAMRTVVSGLVASGQLEFVNGGWCMHDEANPLYVDMLDQTSLGHRWLKDLFNITPKVTWQIDPFGHSSWQASHMSSPMAGYSGVYFMRADYQDIAARAASRTSEMIWSPSPSTGTAGTTYAGILYGGYCTIPGISMDINSDDQPVMDDPSLEDYNVDSIVDIVLAAAADDISKYPQGGPGGAPLPDGTADVMLPLGCDFEYENAATWYTNTDRLIHWLNVDGRVNAFYSTPSIYTEAKLAAGKSYTLKTDDFYPYGFFEHGYLTGFFTSRPGLKGYIRDTSAVFQAAKQVQLFTGGAVDMGPDNPLYRLERAMGLTQHHDAVSGTAKQAVTYDYARRLAWGREDADALFSTAFAALTGDSSAVYTSCDLANATICPALEAGQPTILLVWNQQAQAGLSSSILVPVGFPSGVATWAVYNASSQPITAQLLPTDAADTALRSGYYNSSTPGLTMQWLAFQTGPMPPAGYSVFFLIPGASEEEAPHTHASKVVTVQAAAEADGPTLRGKAGSTTSAPSSITNGPLTLSFDLTTGLLSSYANAATGLTTPLSQTLLWYNSTVGGPHPCPGQHCDQNSGAYIFRPNGQYTIAPAGTPVQLQLLTGPVVNEARQGFSSWASQRVRLWAGETSGFDIEWTVGPIPVADKLGKEIVSVFTSPLATNNTWWTDSNGRDSVTRIRDYRPTWNYSVNEPISGNYYPVPTFLYTKDVDTGVTLSVNTDRAQGGSSMADGSLEVMIHRRLLADDELGVGEPLNEPGLNANGTGLVVRGVHRVSLQLDPASAAVARRTALATLAWRPTLRYSPLPAGMSPAQWAGKYRAQGSGLGTPLPPNIHLLTTHSLGPTTLLLRLSHSYEAGEGGAMSAPATVSLSSLFTTFNLTSCTETTLTGNQPLAAAPKTTYNITGGPVVTLPVVPPGPAGPGMEVTLGPMDIRTFTCTTTAQDARWGPRKQQAEVNEGGA